MNVRYPIDTLICERGHEWFLRVNLTHPAEWPLSAQPRDRLTDHRVTPYDSKGEVQTEAVPKTAGIDGLPDFRCPSRASGRGDDNRRLAIIA
jgi:hypothetical protein